MEPINSAEPVVMSILKSSPDWLEPNNLLQSSGTGGEHGVTVRLDPGDIIRIEIPVKE